MTKPLYSFDLCIEASIIRVVFTLSCTFGYLFMIVSYIFLFSWIVLSSIVISYRVYPSNISYLSKVLISFVNIIHRFNHVYIANLCLPSTI